MERLSPASVPVQHRITHIDGANGVQPKPQKAEKEVIKEMASSENEQSPPSREKVEEAIQGLNGFLEPAHTSLKFEFHEKLNKYYVTIIDDKTSEVVREIPAKKLLDTYAAMTEFLGLMVDKKI